MALNPTSYIKTVAAVDTRTRDLLSFPFTARPQAMSVYVHFVEQGSLTSSAYIMLIGSSTAYIYLASTGTVYAGGYKNTISTEVNSTLGAAPSFGQRVELLLTLTSTGVITISQSIAGAAITSGAASPARVLPTAWGATTLWVNSFSTTGVGFNAFRNIEIMAGVQTMQAMRVRAGTD